ncbi:MAG: NUDIX hydrolase [Anaerolineae bacterium]|nr:NUDIX hydrolase [Anaerolineae bacterium]
MSPQPWKTLSTREVYKNKWIRVREDIAEMPNGKTTVYGVCELGTGECAGVLPFIDDDHVIMVRQYRYIQQENHRWEIPTGGLMPNEPIEIGAQRELMEEIGYRANTLIPITSFYSSKSVCLETCHLFIGRDLEPATIPFDETEFLEIETFSFARVLDMVLKGEIMDAMTVVAVLQAARMRNQ